MFRTTLNNGGVIHAVTLPDIPANWPDGGTVTVTSDCGVGLGEGLPARLARQTTHPSFTGRTVTCSGCLTGQEN